MILQWPQRHELIHEKALISISTVTDQINKIRVMQQTKHQDLYKKLSISLEPISVQLFYGYNLQAFNIKSNKLS